MLDNSVWAGIALVAVIAVYVLFCRLSSSSGTSSAQQQAPRELKHYSMEDVKKHNRPDESVWIVVRYGGEQRVYDITEYCDMHPGGDVIYDSGGKDATDKFNGPQHPPTVHDLIREYHIGWVGDKKKN
jgi:cytochrome b involved in lipid metabolism